MKEIYKRAVRESVPSMVVVIVILLVLYLNALIVQDSITLFFAIVIGYALVTIIIIFEILQLVLLKVKEVELVVKDKIIENLVLELNEMKKKHGN